MCQIGRVYKKLHVKFVDCIKLKLYDTLAVTNVVFYLELFSFESTLIPEKWLALYYGNIQITSIPQLSVTYHWTVDFAVRYMDATYCHKLVGV